MNAREEIWICSMEEKQNRLDQLKLLWNCTIWCGIRMVQKLFSLLKLHNDEVLSSKKQRQGRSEYTTIYMCAYGLGAWQ